MDLTHLHLVITHLPIFSSVLGGLVLAYALLKRSEPTGIAAYGLFIISSIGAGVSYLTGEAAEHTAEHIPGITQNTIERHEEFALFALTSFILLGVLALVAIIITMKKPSLSRRFAVLVLIASLVSFGIVARTGYLGGQIRHTEIKGDSGFKGESNLEE